MDAAPQRQAIPAPLLREIVFAALLYGVFLAVVLLAAFAAPRLMPGLDGAVDRAAGTLLVIAASSLALIPACWWGVRRSAAERAEVLGLLPIDRFWSGRSIAAGLALLLASILGGIAITFFLGAPPRVPGAGEYGVATASPARFVFALFAAAYLTPLAEEMFFRGLLFRGLAPRIGLVAAALLSSAVFGALHFTGGLYQAVIAGLYGLVFCRLYVASGTLWAPVFAHRTLNAAGLTLMWLAA